MTTQTVPEVLHGYANRGLFRDFHADADKGDFGFVWMMHTPMKVKWAADARTITFKDVLPNVPARGEMDREIRDFLKAMASEARPPHRRIDPAEYELTCRNRGGTVSIGLRMVGGDEETATRKLMLTMHEAFLFLHDRWPDYMHEEFGASLE